MTKVIAGFPGVGKTYFKQNTEKNVLDSDSSKFSWIKEGVKNPDFPSNYIDYIVRNSQPGSLVDIILVSTHLDVREGLVNSKVPFTLVYPNIGAKDEYIKRFTERGSPESFIEFISKMWPEFISELASQQNCEYIVLKKNQYLSDVI